MVCPKLNILYDLIVTGVVIIVIGYGQSNGARSAAVDFLSSCKFVPLIYTLDYTGCLRIKSS
jgi:hypothetical protein